MKKEENIKELEFKELIRKRPGMFIGAVGRKGIINLVKELILDANQDLRMENNFFHFAITKDNHFELLVKSGNPIENFLSPSEKGDDCFPISHLRALEALSEFFAVVVNNEFEALIKWSLDRDVIKETDVDYIHLCEELAQVAYLNRGSEILVTDKRKKHLNQAYYAFPEGIKYLYERCRNEALGTPAFEITYDDSINGNHYQIFLGYRTDWYPNPQIISFANEIHTTCGGSLVDGIMEGLIGGCRVFVRTSNLEVYKVKKKKFKNGLILVCSVKGQDFKYGGSFKESLIDEQVKTTTKTLVKRLTLEFLNQNREEANSFLWRFDENHLMSGIM